MSIQCEEFLALSGTMPQNHHRAVIFLRSVVRHRVDDPFQGRIDRTAGGHEKIDAQVNRATLVRRIAARTKKRKIVEQPWFVVSPDPGADASPLQLRENPFGDRLGPRARISA